MYEAARLHDPIAHTSALTGFLIGAVIGIAIIAAVAFSTVTCGFGAALLAGVLAGMMASDVLSRGEEIGRSHKATAGRITSGSGNVFINDRSAAFVEFSAVECDRHAPVKRIAEGSTNVFINGRPAVRIGDHTECDATISGGSGNVSIGGGRKPYLKIDPEIPDSLRTDVQLAFLIAGLVGGLAGAMREAGEAFGIRCATRFVAGYAAGVGIGDLVNRYAVEPALGALAGHPVDVTSGRKVLLPESDFVLPARLPVSCSRFYSSALTDAGLLGPGWRLDWEITLCRKGDGLVYTGPQGREVSFPLLKAGHGLYDASEQIYLSQLHDGRYVVHTLSQHHFVFGAFDADGLARLTMIEGPEGQRIAFTRNDAGRNTDIHAHGGYHLRLHYQDSPERLERIDLLDGGTPGTLVHYGYDSAGYLSSVTDRAGIVIRRLGYRDGLMVSHINAEGFECRYRWETIDGAPRVVEHDTSSGEHYVFRYNFAAGHAKVTDTFGHTAQWDFDAKQQITAYTGCDGASYRFEYNTSGWPTVMHLPGSRTVQLGYDTLGRLTEETDPLGQTTRTDYHASTDRPRWVELDDGRRWRTDYNDNHQVVAMVDPLERCMTLTYGEDSQLQQVTDARGGTVTLKHDTRGRLTARTDCSGKTTRYTYNRDGLPETMTDALGQTTRIQYDAHGRIHTVVRPDLKQERYRWSALGQLVEHIDAANCRQRWERDGLGRVLRHTDAEGRTVRYELDALGRTVTLTNANGASYRFDWDAVGRLIRENRPDGTARQLGYDLAGFVRYSVISAAGSAHMELLERDALGRLVQRSGDHSRTAYRYNRLGQLIEAAREPTEAGAALEIGANVVQLEYDAAGQQTAEHGACGRLTYERDALGNLLTLTLPHGERIETLYYGSGHVHQVRFGTTVIADFERDDLHREILRTQGRLATHTAYTPAGQISWQRTHAPRPGQSGVPEAVDSLLWQAFRYSDNDELIVCDDAIHGPTVYEYDRSGYLLRRAAEQFDNEYFQWDAAGNLLDDSGRAAGKTLPPLLDNLLRRYRNVDYEYDVWGQVTRRNGIQLKWDAEGHLLSVDDGSQRTDYRYDALGRRTAKATRATWHLGMAKDTRPPKETCFVWQGLRLVQEQEDSGLTRTYLYDPVRAYAPLARIDHLRKRDHGRVYHYHTDPAGTARHVTREEGEVVWSGVYSAWGKVRANLQSTDGFAQPLRMPGQYHDEESGLSFNTFRYYDPHCGRFISSDPIGLAGGLNLYRYAANPISWIDPLGLMILYRSMSIDEYTNLMNSGTWSANGTMEGKWFSESYKDAVRWGNDMGHGGDSFRVTQVNVPDDIANTMYANPHLDNIGPARYATLDDLNGNKAKITWSREIKSFGC